MFSLTFSPLLQWNFYSDVMRFFRPCCCTQPTQAATKQSIHTVSGGALPHSHTHARTHTQARARTHTHRASHSFTRLALSHSCLSPVERQKPAEVWEKEKVMHRKTHKKSSLQSPKTKILTLSSPTELLTHCDSQCSRRLNIIIKCWVKKTKKQVFNT